MGGWWAFQLILSVWQKQQYRCFNFQVWCTCRKGRDGVVAKH